VIFDRLLKLLPSWVPFAVAGGLLLALAGGGYALWRSVKAQGAAEVVAADRQAVIDQQRRDAALSRLIVERQAARLADLEANADTIVRRIDDAPRTTGCGPVMRDASRGLHELFERAGAAPAGRQPAAAVPGSGAGTRP
jgi:hypothetical protein